MAVGVDCWSDFDAFTVQVQGVGGLGSRDVIVRYVGVILKPGKVIRPVALEERMSAQAGHVKREVKKFGEVWEFGEWGMESLGDMSVRLVVKRSKKVAGGYRVFCGGEVILFGTGFENVLEHAVKAVVRRRVVSGPRRKVEIAAACPRKSGALCVEGGLDGPCSVRGCVNMHERLAEVVRGVVEGGREAQNWSVDYVSLAEALEDYDKWQESRRGE